LKNEKIKKESKMEEKLFTTAELAKKFNVRPSVIQYLRNEGLIPSIRRGMGHPTLYPKHAIEIIRKRLKSTHIDIEK